MPVTIAFSFVTVSFPLPPSQSVICERDLTGRSQDIQE